MPLPSEKMKFRRWLVLHEMPQILEDLVLKPTLGRTSSSRRTASSTIKHHLVVAKDRVVPGRETHRPRMLTVGSASITSARVRYRDRDLVVTAQVGC